MAPPEGIVVHDPPLTAKRPCAELTLDSSARRASAKAVFGKEHGNPRLLRPGTIEVFHDPSRPADIKLVLTEKAFAQSFATSGAFSRIGLPHPEVYVAGWVRTASLGESWGSGGATLGGGGGVGIVSGRFPSSRRVACPADVPVIAEVAGERATVGHILAGTPIDVADRPGDFSRVQVGSRSVHTADSSSFLARASDLKGCRTLAP
jgi:hypothetical protein